MRPWSNHVHPGVHGRKPARKQRGWDCFSASQVKVINMFKNKLSRSNANGLQHQIPHTSLQMTTLCFVRSLNAVRRPGTATEVQAHGGILFVNTSSPFMYRKQTLLRSTETERLYLDRTGKHCTSSKTKLSGSLCLFWGSS